MTDLRKAAKMALEALEEGIDNMWSIRRENSIQALRQALAQVEQKPVDWEAAAADQAMTIAMMKIESKRKWVGLTDKDFYGQSELQVMAMRYAETKLKEKNGNI